MAEPKKDKEQPGPEPKLKGKPKVELFTEFDMSFDNRRVLEKMNKLFLALDAAGIIEAVNPEKKKNIVCHGSETGNINVGLQ